MKNFDSFDKQQYDWENMDEKETLAALLADGGRDAVKRIGELRGVNYRVCRPHGDTEVRVMTMNVLYVWCDERHHDPHRTKYGRRMERTADCINVYMPDFVGLQEVDRNSARVGFMDQTQVVAKYTGLHGEWVEKIPQYGISMLSKRKPVSVSKFGIYQTI